MPPGSTFHPKLLSVGGTGLPVNLFIHGYKALETPRQVELTLGRLRRLKLPGQSLLLKWDSGRWKTSAVAAGARASYQFNRYRKVLSVNPWMLLAEAGALTAYEAAQFKLMERRSESVGRMIPELLSEAISDRPISVNLIGHSLGARVIHLMLAHADLTDMEINDCIFLGGAADAVAEDWQACLGRIRGKLYNCYSRRDLVLQITPDLKRKVGSRPMPPVIVDGTDRVVNRACEKVRHVAYWSDIENLLPKVWPGAKPHNQ